jgi:hypothetical protein
MHIRQQNLPGHANIIEVVTGIALRVHNALSRRIQFIHAMHKRGWGKGVGCMRPPRPKCTGVGCLGQRRTRRAPVSDHQRSTSPRWNELAPPTLASPRFFSRDLRAKLLSQLPAGQRLPPFQAPRAKLAEFSFFSARRGAFRSTFVKINPSAGRSRPPLPNCQ